MWTCGYGMEKGGRGREKGGEGEEGRKKEGGEEEGREGGSKKGERKEKVEGEEREKPFDPCTWTCGYGMEEGGERGRKGKEKVWTLPPHPLLTA